MHFPQKYVAGLWDLYATLPYNDEWLSVRRKRNKIFISYSHKDSKWLDDLLVMLKPLTRTNAIVVWTDRNVSAGSHWKDEIAAALNTVTVAILLVSPNFLASDFIISNEMMPILKTAESQGLSVIWVPISHCLYKDSPLCQYQAAHDPNRPLDSLSPSNQKKALTRLADIIKLAIGVPVEDLQSQVRSPTHFGMLRGARTIEISISQLFRLIDLLTLPRRVRAKELQASFTKSERLRRALNSRRTFQIPSLGKLRPTVAMNDWHNDFWRLAIPDFRLAGENELWFLPFELKLSQKLRSLQGVPGSALENVLSQCDRLLSSRRIAGRLRIYPPGIGVLRLTITLTFSESIDADSVARIAHGIEELLFVDAEGLKRPCNQLLLNAVQRVSEYLFESEGLSYEERRWLPPEIVYSIMDDNGLDPHDELDSLSHLMYLAPGNEEQPDILNSRIRSALVSHHWRRDQLLATAAQRVSLLFIGSQFAGNKHEKRGRMFRWLTETGELASAVAYAQRAYFEEIWKLSSARLLDRTWFPGGERFEYLNRVLTTMKSVMQATISVETHLKKLGVPAILSFAGDLWKYGNPIPPNQFSGALLYLQNWLCSIPGTNHQREVTELLQLIGELQQIRTPLLAKTIAARLQ